jgi:hypothetical protein
LDPRRTSQALAQPDTILLFCSPGCLRQFVAARKASENGAEPDES